VGEKVAEGRMRVAEGEQNLPRFPVAEDAESTDFQPPKTGTFYAANWAVWDASDRRDNFL
jgi:hypothetical protein